MKKSVIALICFFCLARQAHAVDTTSITVKDTVRTALHSQIKIDIPFKPYKAGLLSAILPGAGQCYTGHYYKSGMFFIAETVIGCMCYNFAYEKKYFHDNTQSALDSVISYKDSIYVKTSTTTGSTGEDSTYYDSTFLGTHYKMKYDYQKFLETENNSYYYQSLIWLIGVYYWNILDAVKNTGYFANDNTRNPATAGWLSAIPVLGLGQFYNGELSKAGMVFTVQLSMCYMVYNYNDLMRTCEKNLSRICTPGTPESRDADSAGMASKWESKRSDAFKNRNMWGWYAIAFYIYGILDAVVDAHLHDAATRIKLEPDLIYDKDKIGMNLKMDF
jgi:hypothetical protein